MSFLVAKEVFVSWDNLVVACASNWQNGDKLLEQTNMKLARKCYHNMVQFSLSGNQVPEWQEFLFV